MRPWILLLQPGRDAVLLHAPAENLEAAVRTLEGSEGGWLTPKPADATGGIWDVPLATKRMHYRGRVLIVAYPKALEPPTREWIQETTRHLSTTKALN